MINFVVCEDNKIILQRNIDIINRNISSFTNSIKDYFITTFKKYNKAMKQFIAF